MDWEIKDKLLVKEFEFRNFAEAVTFVNKIAALAEKSNHHPDILIHQYKKVRVMLYSHDENTITPIDYAMAKEIDKIKL